MSWHRIWGIILRHMYFFLHSPDRMSDAFFWPSLSIILWGIASRYYTGMFNQEFSILLALLSAIILWIFIWRGQYELSVNYLAELWDHNLVNIFISPIRFREYLFALTLVGVIKSITGVIFASLFAYLLYQTNIIQIGWYLIPFSLILIATGWSVGMLVTSMVMRWGTQVQTFAWIGINILAPFIPVYYPLHVLPDWAQAISKAIPATYVFEDLRRILTGNHYQLSSLILPSVLSLIYMLVGLFVIYRSFRSTYVNGLIKNS